MRPPKIQLHDWTVVSNCPTMGTRPHAGILTYNKRHIFLNRLTRRKPTADESIGSVITTFTTVYVNKTRVVLLVAKEL